MYPAERQWEISRLVHAHGRVTLADLSERLGVTTETVRRDLDVLQRQGVLRRVRGGAVPLRQAPFEQTLQERRLEQAEEKRRIATQVVRLLPEDGVLALDSGSLTYSIAAALSRDLPSQRQLMVVTNNLPAVRVLSEIEQLTVFALPGRVRSMTQGAVDEWTRQRLAELNVDLAIVGANGLTLEAGVSTTVPEEAAVKRAMLDSARRRMLSIVSPRIGRDSFCQVAEVNALDVIVTDTAVDPELADALHAAGPELVAV